jgi:cell division septation protein DedD
LERASRLDTFAEQVFEDLWYAIQELVRQEAEDPLVALAPSSPKAMASAPIRSSSHRRLKTGLGVAATITLAVIGLGLFVLSRQTATPPTSIPVSVAIRRDADPPAFPILTQETWQRLSAACQIGPNNARAIPTRAPAGSSMVQVFASADEADAGQALARYSSRRGFLLPQEESGRAVCTVVLGPFASEEAASRAAAELRMSDGTDAKVVRFPRFTK